MNWVKRFFIAISLAGLVTCGGGGGNDASAVAASAPPDTPTVKIQSPAISVSSTGDPRMSWVPIQDSSVTGLKVYRSDSISGFDHFSFLQSLPAHAGLFTDMSCREGVTYQYAIKCVVGSLEGIPALSTPFTVQILGPIDVTAVTTSAGIELHWTNRSTRATQITLKRTMQLQLNPDSITPGLTQSLNPADQQYLDTTVTPGVWCYQLVAGDASMQGGAGWVSALAPTTGTPSFIGHVQPFPFSVGEVINGIPDESGRWELAGYDDAHGYTDYKQLSTGWAASTVVDPAVHLVQPGFALDAAGFPHYVALVGSLEVGVPRDIVHFWKDAVGWKRETIATRAIFEGSGEHTGILFGMRPSGLITLVWQLNDGSQGHHFEFATNESGSWKITPISFGLIDPDDSSSSSYAQLGPIQMALGPDGTTHLGILCWSREVGPTLLLEHRALNGGWSEEFAPTGAIDVGIYSSLQVQPMGQSGLVVAYQRHDLSSPSFGVVLLASGTAGWGAPTVMATNIPDSGSASAPFRLCTSLDGTRSALVTSVPDPTNSDNSGLGDDLLVFILNETGPLNQAVLSTHHSVATRADYAIGFDQLNHLHLLGLHGELPNSYYGQDTLVMGFDESY